MALCPRCRRITRHVDRARAIGEYDGALRAVIHALKYDGRRSLAAPLAARMRERSDGLLEGVDMAVPVPLHWRREWERGFNQAEALAMAIGVPVSRALRRVRATRSQTELPSSQRHRNVRHAFALTGAAAVRGRIVLLVDDVSTTGATLADCARVLKAAGAREVRALTAAKVPTRRPS
jgi:ComF family protein